MIAPFIKAVQVGAEEIYNELMLVPPVLKRVLCNSTNFSFNPRSVIFAKLNPVELREFDALVHGLLRGSRPRAA
jgi:hypothetical protein